MLNMCCRLAETRKLRRNITSSAKTIAISTFLIIIIIIDNVEGKLVPKFSRKNTVGMASYMVHFGRFCSRVPETEMKHDGLHLSAVTFSNDTPLLTPLLTTT